MPQLPDLGASARPLPQPAGGVAQYQTEDFKAAVAPGNAMSELGGQVEQMALTMQKQIDTSRAEDAMNQLQAKKMDLTSGQDGFVNQKGAAAVTQPLLKTYGGQFDDAANQISTSLSTPQQKALFRQRADVAKLQFSDDLLRHLVREGNVYQEQVYKGGVATETANAAAHWDQPDAVALSMSRINGLVDQQAHNNGWAAEYTAAVRQQQLGELHGSVIEQALANKQYVYAQKWFDQHKAEMDPQQLDSLAPKVENGLQKQLVNGYNTQYLAAQDSVKQLAALEKNVAADQGLDDQYKNVLLGRLQSRQDILANQAERAYQHAMTVAGAQYTTLQAVVDKGGAIDPAYADQVMQGTRGTPYAASVQALLEQAKATGGAAQQPLAVQQAGLDALDARIAQDGRSPALDKRRDQLAKVLQGSQTDLKTEGIRAGLQRGVISALAPLDTSSPDALAKSLAPRLQQAAIVGQSWAGRAVSPLTGDEAQAVQGMLATLPPPDKAAAVATIAGAAGPQAAGAIAAQLDAKDRALGLAFSMAGARTTQGRYTSELILSGQQALKDKLPIKDRTGRSRDDVENVIATTLDGVYPNQQLADAARDAALYITAGIAKEQGAATDHDIQRAVNLAIGGSLITHNGRPLPLPAGVDEDMFNDRLAALTSADIIKQTMAGGVANTAGMRQAGNLDPYNRAILHNADGNISTTSSISIGTDGGEVLIPTVVNGKRLTNQQAIAQYRKTGENFGTFDTPDNADRYATDLHNNQFKATYVHAAGALVPVDDFVKSLPGQTLMPVGYGKYAVIVGGRPVKNSAGQNIIIGIQ